MKDILILTNEFEDCNLMGDFLESKKIKCRLISMTDLKNENYPKIWV